MDFYNAKDVHLVTYKAWLKYDHRCPTQNSQIGVT
jgi:hypothetical protein